MNNPPIFKGFKMRYFPIFVDSEQMNVLVVGGGEVATRKVDLLLKSACHITLVSPTISTSLATLHQHHKITYIEDYYHCRYLDDKQLVFVATSDKTLNQQINKDATCAKVLTNVVDDPELCQFITPAIIDRSPITLALCSEGKSPVLIRHWRAKLETLLPHTLGEIADFAGRKRETIKAAFANVSARRKFWQRFFASNRSEEVTQLEPLFQQLLANKADFNCINEQLNIIQSPKNSDLVSILALRNMQKADVAFFHKDVHPSVLELLRRDAERFQIDANSEQDVLSFLQQGLQVCYLSTEQHQADSRLMSLVKQQGLNVQLLASAHEHQSS